MCYTLCIPLKFSFISISFHLLGNHHDPTMQQARVSHHHCSFLLNVSVLTGALCLLCIIFSALVPSQPGAVSWMTVTTGGLTPRRHRLPAHRQTPHLEQLLLYCNIYSWKGHCHILDYVISFDGRSYYSFLFAIGCQCMICTAVLNQGDIGKSWKYNRRKNCHFHCIFRGIL